MVFAAGGTPQYQILAPAYYDQNGQLVMGNGRGMGTPVRLVSPAAPILVNAATGQQGKYHYYLLPLLRTTLNLWTGIIIYQGSYLTLNLMSGCEIRILYKEMSLCIKLAPLTLALSNCNLGE